MTLLGYAALIGAALAAAWGLRVAWHAIRHPAPCECVRCSQRRDRRQAAALAYQKRRGEQHIRRAARTAARTERRQGGGPRADRLITDLREHRAEEEKPLRRREKRALAAIEAAWDRDSGLEPQRRESGQ